MQIVWDEKAVKELKKLDLSIQKRILKSIDELSINPTAKDIKKLIGIEGFRLRLGDYRVIFQTEHDNLHILKVGHRKNIYR